MAQLLNTLGQPLSQAGGSIVPQSNPNADMQTPGLMGVPALNARFEPMPQGSMKAPAVVTSQSANDHINTMANSASTALTDAQLVAAYNKARVANQLTQKTQTTEGTKEGTDSSTDSLLGALGLGNSGTPDKQQQKILSQDETAIENDRIMRDQLNEDLSAMEAGTFPLSPAEQAQVNSTRSQYDSALKNAQQYAKNVQRGATALVAKNQLQMYSPQMALGKIQEAVTFGQSKVELVNSRIASAMSKLTTAIQDGNYKTATRLYAAIGDDIKERSAEIEKINKISTDVQMKMLEHSLDAAQEYDKNITSLLDDLSKNDAPASVRNAVATATDINSAFQAAGDWLQTATGDTGAYLFAKREAQNAGIVPPDYTTWKTNFDKTKLDSELAKYRAEQGIKFDYDVALEKAKASLANQSNPNYKGEFANTIKLAAQSGGTNTQRAAIKSDMESFIADGDYGSAYTAITDSVSNKLKAAGATNFDEQMTSYKALKHMKSLLQEYEDLGGDTNIFKGGLDAVQSKLGVLLTDEKYKSIATELQSYFFQFRQDMTGAAFSGPESAQYKSVLAGTDNTFALNMSIIDGALSYMNSQIESKIDNKVGKGGIYIKQYAEAAENTQKQQTSLQDKMKVFRATSPENESLVQEIHTQYPNLTLDQIAEELGITTL